MNWIKVSDQLPPKKQYIIVYNEEEGVTPVFIWADLNESDPKKITLEIDGEVFALNQFTHWMHLPKQPSET